MTLDPKETVGHLSADVTFGKTEDVVAGRSEELSLAERRHIIAGLQAKIPMRKIADGIGRKPAIVSTIAAEYGFSSPRSTIVPVDVDLFLNAAEVLVRRWFNCAKPDEQKQVFAKYLDIQSLPIATAIVEKFTDLPIGNIAASSAYRGLLRISDNRVVSIQKGVINELSASRQVLAAMRSFYGLEAAAAERVLNRRLGLLPDPAIDPMMLRFLKRTPRNQLGPIALCVRKREQALSVGRVADLESVRPWPASQLFIDAALSQLIADAGFKGPRDLQARASEGVVHVRFPLGIANALQFSLAAAGAIFNRQNIHVQGGTMGVPPHRQGLEALAHKVLGRSI